MNDLATKIVLAATSRMLDLAGVACRTGYILPDGDIQTRDYLMSWLRAEGETYRVTIDIGCRWDGMYRELQDSVIVLAMAPWIRKVHCDEAEEFEPPRVTFSLLIEGATLGQVGAWLTRYWVDANRTWSGL